MNKKQKKLYNFLKEYFDKPFENIIYYISILVLGIVVSLWITQVGTFANDFEVFVSLSIAVFAFVSAMYLFLKTNIWTRLMSSITLLITMHYIDYSGIVVRIYVYVYMIVIMLIIIFGIIEYLEDKIKKKSGKQNGRSTNK